MVWIINSDLFGNNIFLAFYLTPIRLTKKLNNFLFLTLSELLVNKFVDGIGFGDTLQDEISSWWIFVDVHLILYFVILTNLVTLGLI